MTSIWPSGVSSVNTVSDEYLCATTHHFSLFTKYSYLQGTEGSKRPCWSWVASHGIPTHSVPMGPGALFTSCTKLYCRCTCLLTPFSPNWTSMGSPRPGHVASLAMLGVLDGPCYQPLALSPVLRPCRTLPCWWRHCPCWCLPWLLSHLPLASSQPSLLPDANTFFTPMIIVKV